jgi:hypothetical protein
MVDCSLPVGFWMRSIAEQHAAFRRWVIGFVIGLLELGYTGS